MVRHKKILTPEEVITKKEKKKSYSQKYYTNNISKFKEYYNTNLDRILLTTKNWDEQNKNKKSEYQKEWYIMNKEKIRNKQREYERNRYLNDILFKLTKKTRISINKIFKTSEFTKKSNTYKIIGCSYETLLNHIETQWPLSHNLDGNGLVWMNWNNHGLYNGELNYGWDIDHRIPISSAKTEEELIKLCHYTNLQPLCSKVNRDIKKGNF